MKSLLNKPVARRVLTPALLALLSLPTFAQDATNTPDPPGRFLLLVETSSSMRRRADGVMQTVAALLTSDLGGRLRTGDTIGLWTFNADVYAGRLPLQQWSPATREAVASNVLGFLKLQRYEKKANLDKALAQADSLVGASSAITLLLITDGNQTVRGTPFDAAINAIFQANRREQARARVPFVVVLRAEQGRFVNGSVGLPPWRVEVPATPGEIARANRPQSEPPRAETAAPKPEPPPLILKGPKPADAPVAQIPEKPAEQPKPEPAPSSSSPPTAETKSVVTTVAEPQPAASPTTAAGPGPTPAAAPTVTAPEKPMPVAAEIKPAPPPPQDKPELKPAPVPEAPSAKPLPVEPKPESPKLAAPQLLETPAEPAKPASPPTLGPKPGPPTEVAAMPPTGELPKGALPAQEGLLAPEPFLSGGRLLALGVLLLAVAGVLFWLLVRRTRPATPSGSLISQSFERDKKEP